MNKDVFQMFQLSDLSLAKRINFQSLQYFLNLFITYIAFMAKYFYTLQFKKPSGIMITNIILLMKEQIFINFAYS